MNEGRLLFRLQEKYQSNRYNGAELPPKVSALQGTRAFDRNIGEPCSELGQKGGRRVDRPKFESGVGEDASNWKAPTASNLEYFCAGAYRPSPSFDHLGANSRAVPGA